MFEGETRREPFETGVTDPIPRLILKEVALLVVHESIEDSPSCIDGGVAVSVHVGAGGSGVTVTVAVHVAVPPAPVTVPVYVVVLDGETVREPEAVGVTTPIPRLILNAVAFAVDHTREDDSPSSIEVGVAVRVHVGA